MEHPFEFSKEEAQHWLTTAAERGDVKSQLRLASDLYVDGKGDDDIRSGWYLAFPWFLRAAKQGKAINSFFHNVSCKPSVLVVDGPLHASGLEWDPKSKPFNGGPKSVEIIQIGQKLSDLDDVTSKRTSVEGFLASGVPFQAFGLDHHLQIHVTLYNSPP